MQFKNDVSNILRDFSERYVRLPSKDELAKEFLIVNKNNANTHWTFKDGETYRKISEVAQVKVNIRDIGAIIANFNPVTFTKETKNELFEKLLTLKDIDVSKSLDEYKRKVVSVFHFLNEYNPYFVVVDFNDDARESELVISSIGFMSYQIFFIKNDYPEANIVVDGKDEPTNEKKPSFFSRLFKGKNKKKEQPKVEKPVTEPVKEVEVQPKPVQEKEEVIIPVENVEKEPKEKFSLGKRLKRMIKNFVKNKVDFILNILYSALIGITVLLSVIYLSVGNGGIGALFIGFSVVSLGLSVYNIFIWRKDAGKSDVFDNIFFVIFSIVGGALGILVGWIIALTLINKGDTQVDFVKTLLIGGGLTPVAMGAAEGLSFLVLFIYHKIKNRKKDK